MNWLELSRKRGRRAAAPTAHTRRKERLAAWLMVLDVGDGTGRRAAH